MQSNEVTHENVLASTLSLKGKDDNLTLYV